jgi:alginate O-acetyltransferase complex protein AlgI
MLFTSSAFIVFLPVVLTLYWLLHRQQHRVMLLLGASFIFYAWWDVRLLLLLIASSLAGYYSGLALEWPPLAAFRRWIVFFHVSYNLAVLGIFKYFDFFAQNLALLLNTLGFHADWPLMNIILPIGISFYTFQAMGYVFDVYQGRTKACRNYILFSLFISFFPQLVAGPIERADHLLPQLAYRRSFDMPLARRGLRLILWGFCLKLVVADNLSPLVDKVFTNPAIYSGGEILFANYCFAFQFYGDFAGYSAIAIGSAALFGIRLRSNFNSPYFAQNIRDFWQRWHISLSTWFRDYLYILSLGGNQVASWRRIFNILFTFLAAGLWHGAHYTFLCFGLANGLLYFLPQPFSLRFRAGRFLNAVFCFHLVTLLIWPFFRASSINTVYVMWRRMLALAPTMAETGKLEHLPVFTVMAVTLLLCEYIQRNRRSIVDLDLFPVSVRWAVYGILAAVLFFAGNFERQPFVYFQF